MATIEAGNYIPPFELPDHERKVWNLQEQLASGPVVLVFYRGDW